MSGKFVCSLLIEGNYEEWRIHIEAVLVAMKKANGQRSGGTEDALIELIPTQAIEATPSVQSPELWDEWDM